MSRTNPSLSGVFSYNAQSLLSTTCLENRCLEQIPLCVFSYNAQSLLSTTCLENLEQISQWCISGVFSYNAQSLLSTTCLENRCLEQIPLSVVYSAIMLSHS